MAKGSAPFLLLLGTSSKAALRAESPAGLMSPVGLFLLGCHHQYLWTALLQTFTWWSWILRPTTRKALLPVWW